MAQHEATKAAKQKEAQSDANSGKAVEVQTGHPDEIPTADELAAEIEAEPAPYQLFADGDCDARYPTLDYVQEFEFAQFMDLRYQVESDAKDPVTDLRARLVGASAAPLLIAGADAICPALVTAALDKKTLVSVLRGIPVSLFNFGEQTIIEAMDTPPAIEVGLYTPSDAPRGKLEEAPAESGDSSETGPLTRLLQIVKGKKGTSDEGRVPDDAQTEVANSMHLHPATRAKLDRGVLTYIPAIDGHLKVIAVNRETVKEQATAERRRDLDNLKYDRPQIANTRTERRLPRLAGVVPWKQRWKLLGYSRGRLIRSLTLAPQEETTLELFTWDRRKRGLEQTSQTDVDRSFDFESRAQDSIDVLAELTSTSEFDRALGVQFAASYGTSEQTYVKVNADGKLSAKDGTTRVAKTSAKRLTDLTQKASTRVKTSRTSKITDSMDVGREERITRKISNPNLCNTLSFDYYELMVTYQIETTPSPEGTVLCAMVLNPFADAANTALHISHFVSEDVRIYESLLRPYLLNTELLDGFLAARMLEARRLSKGIACESYGCVSAVTPNGHDEKEGADKKEKKTGEEIEKHPWVKTQAWKSAFDSIIRLAEISNALFGVTPDPMMQAWDDADGKAESPSDAQVKDTRRWLYGQVLLLMLPDFQQRLEELKNYSAHVYAGDVAEHQELRNTAERLALVAPSSPGTGASAVLAPVRTAPSHTVDPILDQVIAAYENKPNEGNWYRGKFAARGVASPDEAGLPPALDRFTLAMHNFAQSLVAAPKAAPGADVADDATDRQDVQATEDRLEYNFPLRETAEAMEREDALLKHLNLFGDYYRYILLRGLPPDELLRHLTGGVKDSELGRFLQPRLIAWRGAYVAVPIDTTIDSTLSDLQQSLADGLVAAGDVMPYEVSMPTPGLTLETRLGRCSGCEPFIEATRDSELRLRSAEASLAEQEVRRARQRLDENPPLLDEPTKTVEPIKVIIDGARSAS